MNKSYIFKLKHPWQTSVNFLLGSIIIALTSFIIVVSGAPPTSPYSAGETLSPSCSPGDVNCTVYPPLTTTLTATTTLTLDNYALNFDSGTLYIDSLNNRIGIGTTSPLTKLSVQATAGEPVLNIASSTGASLLYVDESGNVGIGTTNPAYALDIADENAAVYSDRSLRIWAGDGGHASIHLWEAIDVGLEYGMDIDYNGSENRLDFISIENGLVGRIPFSILRSGNVGIGTTSPNAKLEIKGNNQLAASSTLSILDSSDGSLFHIQNDGNVGIGTTNPLSKLEISSDVDEIVDLTIGSEASGYNGEQSLIKLQRELILRKLKDILGSPITKECLNFLHMMAL